MPGNTDQNNPKHRHCLRSEWLNFFCSTFLVSILFFWWRGWSFQKKKRNKTIRTGRKKGAAKGFLMFSWALNTFTFWQIANSGAGVGIIEGIEMCNLGNIYSYLIIFHTYYITINYLLCYNWKTYPHFF